MSSETSEAGIRRPGGAERKSKKSHRLHKNNGAPKKGKVRKPETERQRNKKKDEKEKIRLLEQ